MPRVRANGVDIEYESFGRDGDPLVVFIMGLGAPLVIWPESLYEGLADRGFRVVRFDNRDIGRSTHLTHLGTPNPSELMQQRMAGRQPKAPYSLSDMADDAVGLMSALGAERSHFVGGSMGGMIAQHAAIDYPDRTKSLTSIMSTTGQPFPAPNPEALKALFTPPKTSGRDDLIETAILVAHALAGPGFAESEAEIRAKSKRLVDYAPYDPGAIARQTAAVITAEPRNALLKAVRCPALVLHGDSDPLFPVAAAKDTADSIPGAELVVIPGMGHSIPESLVPVCVKLVGDFIEKAEGRAI